MKMTNVKEFLGFCNEVTLHDHYDFERVLKLKHVRDCRISVLSNCDFISQDKFFILFDVVDDMSLLGKDEMLKT